MGLKDEQPKRPPKKSWLYYYAVVMLVTMLLNALVFPSVMERQVKEVGYNEFLSMVDSGQVKQVARDDTQFTFVAENAEGEKGIYKTGLWPDNTLADRLLAAGVDFTEEIPTQASPLLNFITTWVLPIIMFVIIGQLMSRMLAKRMGGAGNAMTFGKSNAKIYAESETGKTFADVAGQEEAKEALKEDRKSVV